MNMTKMKNIRVNCTTKLFHNMCGVDLIAHNLQTTNVDKDYFQVNS